MLPTNFSLSNHIYRHDLALGNQPNKLYRFWFLCLKKKSISVDYLMPKSSLEKNSCGTNQPIVGGGG